MVPEEEPFVDEIKDEKEKIRDNLQEFLKGRVIEDAMISFTDTHEIDSIILKFRDESCAKFSRHGVMIKDAPRDAPV